MLLAKIREGTAGLHEETEKTFQLDQMTSIEAYTRVLRSFESLYSQVEPQIQKSEIWKNPSLDYRPFSKLQFIQKDLHELNAKSASEEIRDFKAPFFDTPSKVVGALYVLEGSMLGGQMIAKHLENALGLTADRGLSFYRCYGNESRKRWTEFMNFITQYEIAPECKVDEVISGAQQTFRAVGSLLTFASASARL